MKKYICPKLTIFNLYYEDIITTSDGVLNDNFDEYDGIAIDDSII